MNKLIVIIVSIVLLLANSAMANLLKLDLTSGSNLTVDSYVTVNIDVNFSGHALNDMELQMWFNDNTLDYFSTVIHTSKDEDTVLPGGIVIPGKVFWQPIDLASPGLFPGLNKIDNIMAGENIDLAHEGKYFYPEEKSFETLVSLVFKSKIDGIFDVSDLVEFAGEVPGDLSQKGSILSIDKQEHSFGAVDNPFAVPVPSSLLLLGGGLCALFGLGRRRPSM